MEWLVRIISSKISENNELIFGTHIIKEDSGLYLWDIHGNPVNEETKADFGKIVTKEKLRNYE